jgi:hypothetical protein
LRNLFDSDGKDELNMTENETSSDQSNIESSPEPCESCPCCGNNMEMGILQVGGHGITRVFIDARSGQENKPEYLPLSVCFCRDCGNVFLFTG